MAEAIIDLTESSDEEMVPFESDEDELEYRGISGGPESKRNAKSSKNAGSSSSARKEEDGPDYDLNEDSDGSPSKRKAKATEGKAKPAKSSARKKVTQDDSDFSDLNEDDLYDSDNTDDVDYYPSEDSNGPPSKRKAKATARKGKLAKSSARKSSARKQSNQDHAYANFGGDDFDDPDTPRPKKKAAASKRKATKPQKNNDKILRPKKLKHTPKKPMAREVQLSYLYTDDELLNDEMNDPDSPLYMEPWMDRPEIAVGDVIVHYPYPGTCGNPLDRVCSKVIGTRGLHHKYPLNLSTGHNLESSTMVVNETKATGLRSIISFRIEIDGKQENDHFKKTTDQLKKDFKQFTGLARRFLRNDPPVDRSADLKPKAKTKATGRKKTRRN